MPRNLVRLLAALFCAVLLLGACGDDDGDSSATSTTAAPAGDGAAEDGDDPTGTTDDDTATPDDTLEGDEASRGSGSGSSGIPNVASLAQINDFCSLFEMFDDIDDPFEVEVDDVTDEEAVEQMAEAFTFIEAYFGRAAQLAPDELRADLGLLAGYMGEYNALLAEYDYDFMALAMASATDPELEARFTALESEELDAGLERIETYVLDECGVDLNS